MEIGKLDRKIELIKPQRTQTAAGGMTRSDAVIATVWGNVRQASVGRQLAAARLEQRHTHVITIRWRRDFIGVLEGPEARARYTDKGGVIRELAIHTVSDPDGRTNWLELVCAEGGPT